MRSIIWKRFGAIIGTLGLLGSLLAAPAPAPAQVINVPLCNGYEIGAFCFFITQNEPDAVLDCMDCVDLHCDFECAWYPFERYRYCILIGYATCLGDFVFYP